MKREQEKCKEKRNRGCFGKSKKSDVVIPEEEEHNEPFVLRDLNLSFNANQLTAVVGHVGCGTKSGLFLTARQVIAVERDSGRDAATGHDARDQRCGEDSGQHRVRAANAVHHERQSARQHPVRQRVQCGQVRGA